MSLWLKCDPESPVLGLNWVSNENKGLCERWKDNDVIISKFGGKFETFSSNKMSGDRKYVHWSPLPAQRHIMYVIFNISVLYLMMMISWLSAFFAFISFFKLEICVVAYSAWIANASSSDIFTDETIFKFHLMHLGGSINVLIIWTLDVKKDQTPIGPSIKIPCLVSIICEDVKQ